MNNRILSALKVAGLYALFAGLWIVFSDMALEATISNIRLLSEMQTYKGWLFVLVTSVLLFLMVKRSVESAEAINEFDALTGLLNHHMFASQLDRKLKIQRQEQMLVVIYLDIDHFSDLNQSAGFGEANKLLTYFSRALKEHYSAHVLLARFPPDQFAIAYLSSKTLADIEADIRGLQRMFERCMYEQNVDVTCTLGISLGPGDGRQSKSLMSAAAQALNQAKKSRRNTVQFFNKKLSELENQRQRLLQDLKKDLRHERLSLVYQPQYRLKDRTLTGVEVLIRWHHEEQGFIPPDVFIPLAEENGISEDISSFVVRRAYRDLKEKQLLGEPIERVSINISAVEFNSRKMLDSLMLEIERLPGLRNWLQIEITETATLSNLEKSADNIKALKAEGLKFSVDDFGTGYTSLAMLKDLPIDEVKIDRSFVNDMTEETKARAIVEAIVGMTDGFGISIIAEGIETKTQLSLLNEIGCAEGQGYYLAKPMNIDDLASLVLKSQGASE